MREKDPGDLFSSFVFENQGAQDGTGEFGEDTASASECL